MLVVFRLSTMKLKFISPQRQCTVEYINRSVLPLSAGFPLTTEKTMPSLIPVIHITTCTRIRTIIKIYYRLNTILLQHTGNEAKPGEKMVCPLRSIDTMGHAPIDTYWVYNEVTIVLKISLQLRTSDFTHYVVYVWSR